MNFDLPSSWLTLLLVVALAVVLLPRLNRLASAARRAATSAGSTDGGKAAWVGALPALGGFVTLVGAFFYLIRGGEGAVDRWQALGMLAVAVAIAFAVSAMLRFALAPLIAPISSAATADANAALRNRIAPIVLSIGSLAIVALALGLIISFDVLASREEFKELRPKIDSLLTGVFSTVLPVVATWVATVLAFYFGSENFRQATQSTRDVLSDRLTPRRKITDVMKPYDRIARLFVDNDGDARTLPMSEVIHTMSEAAPRVIVFNKKTQTPIYVIRSNSPPMPDNWVTSDYKEGPDSQGKKIQDYLEANDHKNNEDAENFRFIGENETPETAFTLMKKEGVDDLFITNDGQKTSPVLGWVAGYDLTKT